MATRTTVQLDPGIAVYTPRMLRFYDLLVHRISNRFVWRCPTARLVEQYDRHVSARHLDVGPGTGLLLDRCRFPVARPELTLLDANPGVLAYAARRLARYLPTTMEADVRRPLSLGDVRFDSIGLSYVLHCIPSSMADKARILSGLAGLLSPGGILFGSTILADGVDNCRRSRVVMGLYNRKEIFGNAADNRDELEAALSQTCPRFELEVVGSVALFAGSVE